MSTILLIDFVTPCSFDNAVLQIASNDLKVFGGCLTAGMIAPTP